MSQSHQYIRWFNELTIQDIPLVGGKNASLGEMYRELATEGVIVPNGFAITAEAYREMLDQALAWPRLHELLDHLDPEDVADLAHRAQQARDLVYAALLPLDLQQQILAAFTQLQQEYGDDLTVAVRSSATRSQRPLVVCSATTLG